MRFTSLTLRVAIIVFFLFGIQSVHSQMRQIYFDPLDSENTVRNVSFYTASTGYVAFAKSIGYTTDSGRTFTRHNITNGNVNYGQYDVNLTFGFGITGVHAFSRDTLLVYGHYGYVPAILYSTNGASTFTLVYHTYLDLTNFSAGVTGITFPGNGNVGYAIEFDRIIKSADRGKTWFVIRNDYDSYFDFVEGIDQNTAFAFSVQYTNKLVKITGGNSSQTVNIPSQPLHYVHFISANKGWLNAGETIYYTSDGGNTWTPKNVLPFACYKMKFINDSTGYAIAGENVYKTSDSGKVWEILPNVYTNYDKHGYHNDLFFWNSQQFWAAGNSGNIDITTNGGGAAFPKAVFRIDTANYHNNGTIKLVNFSKTHYTFKWYRNDALISTDYNTSYTRGELPTLDVIKLVVTSGAYSDTLIIDQYFNERVKLNSFSPFFAADGHTVTLKGKRLNSVTAVYFGGVPAKSFRRVGDTVITAVVDNGATGSVKIVTQLIGVDSLPGFTFVLPPTITSFTPTAATAGTFVNITGTNFVQVTQVRFGGIPATGFSVLSPTSIRAVVPSGNSGKIMVLNIADTAEREGFVAIPKLTSFTPTTGTRGTLLHITGTSLTETNAITVGGVPATFKANSSTSVTATLGYGASGRLVLTAPGGSDSLAGFNYTPPPQITSINPATGPVGTTVTITGINFDAVAANNIVYFGAVRAIVTGGNSNSLTVSVPVGATYMPVSVTNTNKLTAFSTIPFEVTFLNGGSGISPNTFVKHELRINPDAINYDMPAGDIDGDGKTDLVLQQYATTILRNTSTGSTVSFTPYNHAWGGIPGLGDFDGDGKLDLAIANGVDVLVFRNTSTPGNISFAAPLAFSSPEPGIMKVADMDEDGKTDIITGTGGLSVLRNISEPGKIDFLPGLYQFGGNVMTVKDLDLDGKPDAVISGHSQFDLIIAKNTSTSGHISFDTHSYSTPGGPRNAVVGDLDGDGLPDIATAIFDQQGIQLFRNKSTSGTFTFEPVGEIVTMREYAAFLALGDFDGDGKPDIAAKDYWYELSLFKNTSTPGTISFGKKIVYDSTWNNSSSGVTVADINGDGKYDIVVNSDTAMALTVYINDARPKPYIYGFTPTLGAANTIVEISGINLTGTTAVSFGGVAAASFTIVNDTLIRATVGTGGTGAVAVTNAHGSFSLKGYLYGNLLTLNSFTPASGPVGSSVTINGVGFSSVAGENIVYIGGIKTTVTNASANALTVTIPAGASTEIISVTVKGRSVYSTNPFVVTFDGNTSGFTQSSFEMSQQIFTDNVNIADIDNDGRPDLILLNSSHAVSVALNNSTPGNVAFANAIDFEAGSRSKQSATGDLDGDGKIDIVVLDANSNKFSILRNTSAGSNISFAGKITYTVGAHSSAATEIAVMDLDADGRPEIVIVNEAAVVVSIFKNHGTTGNIEFELAIELSTPGYALELRIADLDGDNKPDIIAEARSWFAQFAAFRNTSAVGKLSFAEPVAIYADLTIMSMTFGDLDQDNLRDFVLSRLSYVTSVRENESTPGNISFPGETYLDYDHMASNSSIGDLDGDARPDLVIPHYDDLYLYKNRTEAGGEFAFDDSTQMGIFGGPVYTILADVDTDGVLDIILYYSSRVAVLRNLMGTCSPAPPRVSIVATDTTICSGASVTFAATGQNGGGNPTWQWSINGNNVGTNSPQFTTNTITATSEVRVIMTSSSACATPASDTAVLMVIVNPALTSSVTVAASPATACPGMNITFTATPVNGGTAPRYQWKKNGVNVGTNNPVYSDNSLVSSDSINVTMTSSAECTTPAMVTSRAVRVIIGSAGDPVITIAGNTNVEPGDGTLLTTTITNPGATSAYQWQDSTAMHGWQDITGATSATLDYDPLISGDKVRCRLTSTVCGIQRTILSNALSFNVLTGGRIVPNPVVNFMNIVDLKLSDNWERVDIVNLATGATVMSENIQNQTSVQLFVVGLKPGLYAAVLKRSSGPPHYIKFVKL